jgi:site-specific DNA recombinase
MTAIITKIAIYARYSSDRQSERSIEDQVRLCRERAAREGWTVVDVFPDFALSGATRDRPGLNAMLSRIGEFDIILAESLDRISRDQEDVAAIWKRVEFAGCRLHTVSEGAIGELQIGFTGTMSTVFLKNLGDKTRRGQVGRVAAGRIPGDFATVMSLTFEWQPMARWIVVAAASSPNRQTSSVGSTHGARRGAVRASSFGN